jgi:hypothetical protein
VANEEPTPADGAGAAPVPAPATPPDQATALDGEEIVVPGLKKERITVRAWAHEDSLRGYLAIGFAALFSLTVFWACYAAAFCPTAWTSVKEALQILLPAETALLGSVVGFYFGAKKS